jgi:hypothetical protein
MSRCLFARSVGCRQICATTRTDCIHGAPSMLSMFTAMADKVHFEIGSFSADFALSNGPWAGKPKSWAHYGHRQP